MIDFLLTACVNNFDIFITTLLFLSFGIGFVLGIIQGVKIVGGSK